jgi:hypothetical protein
MLDLFTPLDVFSLAMMAVEVMLPIPMIFSGLATVHRRNLMAMNKFTAFFRF